MESDGVANVEPPSGEANSGVISGVIKDVESDGVVNVGPQSGGAASGVIKEEPSWSCWASGRGRGRRGGQAALQVGHYAARI